MTKIFKIPFATQGDRNAIPDAVQGDGSVSYTQGYSYDYERDQQTDPAAKDIEREKMNALFHDITGAIGELQSYGIPLWAVEGKPYPIRSVVYHKNKTWQSKIENNNVEPAAGAAWQELKADLTAGDIQVYNKTESDKRFQPLGNYQTAGYSYSKAESDTHFQPKGNYAPAGNYAVKGESYTKAEGDTRYQPKGSYQPSGDYATNTVLKNGLDGKFDKAGGKVTGTLDVEGYLTGRKGRVSSASDGKLIQLKTDSGVPMILSSIDNVNFPAHALQNKSGTLMHHGDYGFGGSGEVLSMNEQEMISYYKSRDRVSHIFRNSAPATPYHFTYAATFFCKAGDTYTAISADYSGKGVRAIGGNSNKFFEYNFWTDRNTTKDANGFLSTGSKTALITDNIAQTTGTSTTSVMSQKAVTDALQNAVNLNTIYPVGIVVWFAQNKNPNTLFPGTKWQYIGENKTIRLANSNGDNVLKTGGGGFNFINRSTDASS
ncbi:phage tail protein [Providencia stuartii]|uniref:phage tail protein n=1 Tax=Providencia stuartii TaxID=588 RepID=UPI002AA0D504|nr:phage tail protein [Providencia stuartii]